MQKIENEFLRVIINDTGAELWELWNKASGEQLIWEGLPEIWGRHAPILFPFVGKNVGDAFRYKNRNYLMGQHGFARDLSFRVVQKEEDYVTHELCSNEETKKCYPFEFCLRVTHRLEGKKLFIDWEVKNLGKESMYFKIGGHPGFSLPEMKEEKEYKLCFPKKETLSYILLDSESKLVLPEKGYTISLEEGCFPIGKHLFDKDALIFDDGQIEEVSVLRPDGSKYVTLFCKGFESFGIWAKPGAPYVCLEPWDGRCDDLGCTQELEKKPGLRCIEPEENYKKGYYIEV